MLFFRFSRKSRVPSVELLSIIMISKLSVPAFVCIEDKHLLSRSSEFQVRIIIESFNDAAYPFAKADECDIVLCVSNDTIFLFERDGYFSAIESYSGRKSKLQLTLSDIFKQSLVKQTFHIQPLTKQEQNDSTKLKENYFEIAQVLQDFF